MKKLLCLICCSLFIFVGCGNTSYMQSLQNDEVSSEDSDTETTDNSVGATSVIYVQVSGAVKKPGVYELVDDARVFEAIDAAGGLTEDADDTDLNQAILLEDGQRIYVYTKQETAQLKSDTQESSEDDGLININTATAEELESLPGIGASKANLIISFRETNGAFGSIEDIKNVSGIGDGIYNQIQSLIKI